MSYSERCHDPKTYWDRNASKCLPCAVKPGYGITPNCGRDDHGGKHEPPTKKCKAGTFNDGSGVYCQPCTLCPPGYSTVSSCTSTADTKCQGPRSNTTTVPVPVVLTLSFQSPPAVPMHYKQRIPRNNYTKCHHRSSCGAVPLVLLISIIILLLPACVMYRRRKRGQLTAMGYNRRSIYTNAGFSPLPAPPSTSDLGDTLSPNILSAPLQSVLDNLDVLEELVVLLDPESHGVKNTKHLASHCSFPSTWITYTYSMKDSKSPLKAVLEGVTSRHPDWTVGHLAKLLRQMERNDAVVILTKLGQNEMPV
ncbi:IGF-like family receptor 1 [Pempheris klunzingeri]|uniref:IGF-like family receptor 1 n=1 Tax=Pempheris klunzingeri TaxID=3127111 RepID=UPI003981794B